MELSPEPEISSKMNTSHDFKYRYVNNLEVHWKISNHKYRKGLIEFCCNTYISRDIKEYESSSDSSYEGDSEDSDIIEQQNDTQTVKQSRYK